MALPFRIRICSSSTVNVPADGAMEHFGFLGMLVGLDIPASSAITRELTGWQPTHPTLIEDLEEDFYYRA